jgi:tripartite-type tricarboxylate transporter receptor subunit TctC
MPGHPEVQSAFNYTRTEEQKRMLRFVFASERFVRSYVLPPNVPADRANILRQAIFDAANDPDLLAEAKKGNLDMTYQPPEGVVALLQELMGSSPEFVERVKKIVPIPN